MRGEARDSVHGENGGFAAAQNGLRDAAQEHALHCTFAGRSNTDEISGHAVCAGEHPAYGITSHHVQLNLVCQLRRRETRDASQLLMQEL